MGDFRLAAIIAGDIARRATDTGTLTLVAPTLPFGAADHFGAIPGGLALAPATFRAVLADLLADLRRNGLTRVIILNGHGGNVPLIHEVTLAIRRAGGPIIPSVYLWKIARRLMERRIGPAGTRFGHGGEPLASITLALRPDHARPDHAVPPAAAARAFGCPVAGFGAIGFEDIEIDCVGPALGATVSNHPLTELRGLIDGRVIGAASFRTEIAAIAEELLAQLPPECRRSFGDDEAAREATLVRLADEGVADVLARLHGATEAEPA
jgi:hypothetical protein